MSHVPLHDRGADAREGGPAPDDSPGRPDRGQATTEYALVMLAAALVALLVVAWATSGGGAGKIGQLFDGIIDGILGRLP